MNPNQPRQPYAPAFPQMAKPLMGGRNPYGFGKERVAGKLALQRNVPGMPTNTVPLPAIRQPHPYDAFQRLRAPRNILGGY